jgi:5'-methylthioadenosine phosphorylase
MPEAAIARELAVCYTAIALVTDLDAGVEGGEGVTHHEVLRVFAANVERLKTLVSDVVPALRRTATARASTRSTGSRCRSSCPRWGCCRPCC